MEPKLNYFGQRRTRVPLVVAAGVAMALFSAVAVMPSAIRFAGYLRLRRAWQDCASFKPQPRSLAYANAPKAMAGRDIPPNCVVAPDNIRISAASKPPDCWSTLQTLEFGENWTAPLLFLGMRTSPSGNVRLVAVELQQSSADEFYFSIPIGWSVILPPEIGHGIPAKMEAVEQAAHARAAAPRDDETLYVYRGCADPNDKSKFVIHYRLGGKAGTIDGWLTDRDTVALEFESGPGRE